MDISTKIYGVKGMHCAGCVASVEKTLLEIKGVYSAVVNLNLENVKLGIDTRVTFKELNNAIQKSGYTLVLETTKEYSERKKQEIHEWLWRTIYCGILVLPLLIIAMGEMKRGITPSMVSTLIQIALTTPIIIICRYFYINGVTALIHRRPNMNSLVALGTGAAYVYSIISTVNMIYEVSIPGFDHLYFESSGIILFFITLGRYLESNSKMKTTQALMELLKKAPKTGWVKKEDKWKEVSMDKIEVGDEVMIKPGGQVPVDGVIIKGASFIDESSLTGEFLALEKQVGDMIMGASLNTSGVLIMRAEKVGKETIFSRIIQLVENTQNTKAPIQSMADKVAAVFVPVVLALALISFVGWIIIGKSLVFSMNILITVLIIACPCALGLATPTAIAVGMGKGAKLGIHYKSSDAIQKMNEIDTVVFDKTGTLTIGKPEIIDFVSSKKDEDFIRHMAALAQGSNHPLSEAIINFSRIKNIQFEPCHNLEVLPGKGIRGCVNDREVVIGSFNWFTELAINIPENLNEKTHNWESDGKTIIYVAIDQAWIGMVAIEDTLRKESKDVVKEFQKNGMQIYLLTGDQKSSAEYFSKRLGINKVYAEVLPSEKANIIKELKKKANAIVMIGDGINDAPALAMADVGIALGSGTDVAMETSDIVILRNNLSSVFNVWQLSQTVMNKIKQNLFWAFSYNIIGIPIAMGLLYPINDNYLLNPMFAGVAMAFSSVSVVVNTLLLRGPVEKQSKN